MTSDVLITEQIAGPAVDFLKSKFAVTAEPDLWKSADKLKNLARGEVVDETGLIRALQEKRIAGAGLDVRQQEPPPTGALSEMENVILTPHIAAFTHEAQARVTAAVCQDVAAVLEGKSARNAVNFPKPRPPAEPS